MNDYYIVSLYLQLNTDLKNLEIAEASANALIDDPDAPAHLKTVAQDLLVKLGVAKTAIMVQLQAFKTAEEKTALKNTAVDDFELVYTSYGEKVSTLANGVKAVIDKYKLPSSTKGKQPPIGHLPSPPNFHVNQGDNDGEIDLMWEKVKGRINYQVLMNSDPDGAGTFVIIETPTKTKITIKNLISGKAYSFKVVAVGTEGVGDYSAPVRKVAP